MTTATEASHCYDAYRMAGELFGRLQSAIKCGELTMRQNATAVSYVWEFSMTRSAAERSKTFACQWSVLLSEFGYLRPLEREAEEIAERWKKGYWSVVYNDPHQPVAGTESKA